MIVKTRAFEVDRCGKGWKVCSQKVAVDKYSWDLMNPQFVKEKLPNDITSFRELQKWIESNARRKSWWMYSMNILRHPILYGSLFSPFVMKSTRSLY